MPNSKKDGFFSSPLLDRPRILFAEPGLVSQCLFYGVLLAVGAAGALGCLFGAFQIPVAPLPAVLTGLICLLFTLGLFLWKRSLWIPTLLVLALWVGLVWRFFQEVTQGCAYMVNQILAAYENKLGVALPSLLVSPELTGQDIQVACTLFCCLLIFPFLFFLGWLLVGRKSGLGAFCLTGLPLAVPMIISLVPPVPWLALLLLFWAVLLLFSPSFGKRHRLVEDRGRFYASGTGLARPAMLLLLVCAGVLSMAVTFWLVPYSTYQRPQLVVDLQEGFLTGFGLESAFQGGVASGNSRVSLNSLGARNYTGETVLRVRYQWQEESTQDSAPTNQHKDYLKSFVGSVYTGTSWERLGPENQQELSALLGEVHPQTLLDRFSQEFTPLSSTQYTLQVENVAANPRCLYLPYGLVENSVDPATMAYVSDGFLRSAHFFSGTPSYQVEAWGIPSSLAVYPSQISVALMEGFVSSQEAQGGFADYQFMQQLQDTLPTGGEDSYFFSDLDQWTVPQDLRHYLSPQQQELVPVLEAYNRFVYDHYTQLPSELEAVLHQYLEDNHLTFSTLGTAYSPLELAQQVANTLAAQCVYTLTPPPLPEGEDFVEYFLQESHQGYCVHFATAAVTLLRAMGIPARYAEGYAVPSGEEDWVDVPDYNAHAWVELYIGGTGWVPVEVTPAGPDAPAATQDARPMASQEATATPTPTPTPTPSPSPAPTPEEEEPASPLPTPAGGTEASPVPGETPSSGEDSSFPWIWATAAGILAAALLVLAALVVRRQVVLGLRDHRLEQKPPNQAALQLYKEILELYQAAAVLLPDWEVQPPTHLKDLALKARFSQHTLTDPELDIFLQERDRMVRFLKERLPLVRRLWLAYGPVLF